MSITNIKPMPKPKPKIPNSRKAALEHRKRIERYAALINQLYDKLNKEAAKIALSTGYDPAAQFLWSDYPETRKALKDLQEQYVSEMTGIVMAGTSAEWKESDLVQDLVAQKLLKAYTGTTKAGDEYARYFQTDPDALKAFQQRKAGGMNLSQRVWNLSEQYKTELEMALSAAIEPGTSAMELAADIKTYLNEPDKMFRRFRYKDEEGNWQRKWKQKVTDADGKVHFIDADPKAYHPGRGVYRSSARNAQRLARTEINMAYRKAEQERWESFDFVVGYEVKITQNGKHVEDICDCLKGKYRKDFKFMGWHPQCMCYTIPILKTEDEFFDDDDDAKSVNEVEDVPQGFVDWVENNAERIEAAEKRGTAPYFIADNRDTVKRILEGGGGSDGNSKDDAEAARIEANRREYERLKVDPNYTDVEFNPKNGGLKARHTGHIIHFADNEETFFDGKYTSTDLEIRCQDILYKNGHSCILANEVKIDATTGNMLSLLDTITNGEYMDIRAITKNNRNTIRNAVESKKGQLKRFNEQNNENASSLILYFEDASFFDEAKVKKTLGGRLKKIISVLNAPPHGQIIIYKK